MMLAHLPPAEGQGAEADRFLEYPHPREMLDLVGHREAEQEFLASWQSGRLHHAWLISGDEGIGKATLAYRIARFMLAHGTAGSRNSHADLAVAASNTVANQVAASAHPDLSIIRRGINPQTKNFYTEIRVEDVRNGLDVFNKTAAFGGYRICIVDSCDELNINGQNALLKTLEEPPALGLFLLIAHAPGRLLPTIRSRCRPLPLRPLERAEIAAALPLVPGVEEADEAAIAGAAEEGAGSLRRALAMLDAKRLAFAEKTRNLLAGLPAINGALADSIAESTTGRAGDDAFESFCAICEGWMEARLHTPEGPADMRRLSLAWASFAEKRRTVDGLNLDRRPFVHETLAMLAGVVRP
jgi:DNA polymerase-3 subunit delta'